MQTAILKEQERALRAVLSDYPEVQLAGRGSHVDSLKNWFVITHAATGKWFSMDAATVDDLHSPQFMELLKRHLTVWFSCE